MSTDLRKTQIAGAASAGERARGLTTAALPGAPAASPTPEAKDTSPASGGAPIVSLAKPAEPKPTPLVRSIQKKLAQLGYRDLPQNGLPGPETRAAILAAEFEQGLPLTGEPADTVLAGLYFLEASGRTKLAPGERFEKDPKLVKDVQEVLAKLGYSSGPLDGQLDAKTREAIRKFQADRRLKADGRLTERILLEMVLEKGKPLLSKG